jgi:Holliday junction resolvase-like predicted endonuclease
MTTEWYWEGNIVKAVVTHLEKEGWIIKKTANTITRESGVDIEAQKGDALLLIEVKGYPSKVYQRGAGQGKPKRTNPSTQARHWYSEVLFCAILRQAENPNATTAIALPDFAVFINLVNRTRHALEKLGIRVYLVEEDGLVKFLNLK